MGACNLKIAVLGSGGFLGKQLVTEISEGREASVLAVSRDQSRFTQIESIHSKDFLEHVGLVDAIVNCAVDYGRNSPLAAYEVNLEWPLAVIKKASSLGVSFFSVNTFYSKFPLSTYSPLRSYSLTKALMQTIGPEVYAKHYRGQGRFIDLRLEHLYGPGDSKDKFIPWLLGQMKEQVGSIELTDGLQTRDFIYVEDAALMILESVRNVDNLDLSQSLELGTSKPKSVADLVAIASKITKYRGMLNFGSKSMISGEIEHSVADPYLARYLKMEFRSLESGLKKTLVGDAL
jgi:CDP-paratose synthetase